MSDPVGQSPEEFEQSSTGDHQADYVLRLFVAGMTARSTDAIARIKTICEAELQGRYALEVIDIYQQPALAQQSQIIATPTLVKSLPLPLRRLVGDLSNKERVLLGLDVREVS